MAVRVLAAMLLVLATSAGAIPLLPIADLIRNPDAYANTTVALEGAVTSQSIGYLGETAYTLQGGDDFRVTVFGRGDAPAPGTRLLVTGTVRRKPPDEEFDFPPVIIETSRQVQ